MRAGMGDVVFAPFYEVLKRRGVRFEFFHRLRTCASPAPPTSRRRAALRRGRWSSTSRPRSTGGGEYEPLIEVNGVRCWPAGPTTGSWPARRRWRSRRWDFESHWDRRKVGARTLEVRRDFDLVVLGVGLGAIPHVCQEILARDARWRDMVANVKTVATQAFQIWLSEDLQQLGWDAPPVTLAGFAKPFDTWADMAHVVPAENWPEPPRSVAYFCGVLADRRPSPTARTPATRRGAGRRCGAAQISFLNAQVRALWPGASARPGKFRWELLVGDGRLAALAAARGRRSRFATQYWTANVNPSDRYVLTLPGSLRYRISPLDNTYDNLTIAGDWTDSGFNMGCVEAAVMSGRLAAHAIANFPALEDITGYDHP